MSPNSSKKNLSRQTDGKDEYFISRALNLAKKGQGLTSPNPAVGAVVVKNGIIIGEGFHEKAGQPHAEVIALNNAGKNAEGAAIYVTLEPCSHFGKTPPCVHKIKESGIKRVVSAIKDPNPLVSGKGLQYLINNGIEVKDGVLSKEANQINENFFKYITTGMPFITVKEAVTLDGNLGYKTDTEKVYISSPKSLEYTHYIRFINDAVMISVKTLIKDDPMLDVRIKKSDIKEEFFEKKWTKIVLDSDLKTPPDSKIFESRGVVLIFASNDYDKAKVERKKHLEEKGAIITDVYYNIIEGKKLLNLESIFKKCGELKITGILVEAGPELFSSLIKERFCDKIIFNVTPHFFGRKNGLDLFGRLNLEFNEKINFSDLTVKKIKDEVFLSYYPEFA